jgi:hypothetical protein
VLEVDEDVAKVFVVFFDAVVKGTDVLLVEEKLPALDARAKPASILDGGRPVAAPIFADYH